MSMEYELYWNINGNEDVPTKMVISGSFGTLMDARAYAYSKIGKVRGSTNILSKTSKIIEILGVDRDGILYDCGKVGTMNYSDKDKVIVYKPRGKRSYYRLSKNGSIRKV